LGYCIAVTPDQARDYWCANRSIPIKVNWVPSPPRWVSAPRLYIWITTQQWSQQYYSQNPCRPFLFLFHSPATETGALMNTIFLEVCHLLSLTAYFGHICFLRWIALPKLLEISTNQNYLKLVRTF